MQRTITLFLILIMSTLLNAATNWAVVVMGDITTFVPYKTSTQPPVPESDNSILLSLGKAQSGVADRGTYSYYKMYAHAGERIHIDLYNQDANGNLYVKVGSKASKESYDCKSENGGKTHSAENDSCSLLVDKDSFVYIAVHAPSYGCFNNVQHTVMVYKGDYGVKGPYEVLQYDSGNTRSYYPKNLDKSPIVIFLPGWFDNTFDTLVRHDKLLRHIASQGYTVITKLAGTTMDEHFNVDFSDVLNLISDHSSDLDTKRVGVIGWSHGGGLSFSMMRELVNAGYGTKGRFIMPIEPMFAIGMNQQYMHQLNNINFVMMRFESLEEDPRTNFVEYKLLDGENIDKNYINLEKHEHDYLKNVPKPFSKPMDALMAYTLKDDQDAHDIALEGAGKENPKNVETPLDTGSYGTSCATSNYWANHNVESVVNDIDYCAEVY